jgi:hypothetical protein
MRHGVGPHSEFARIDSRFRCCRPRNKIRQIAPRTGGPKRDLDVAGGEEGERLGGAQMLRKMLAEEIDEASGLVAQIGARMLA